MADGDKDALLIEMGITLQRVTRELAKAEARSIKAAKKAEDSWRRSNDRAAGTFSSLDKRLRGTTALVGTLGNVLAGAFSVRQIQRYADAWTVAENKIAAASEISGRAARSTAELNDLADETRSGLTETVDLYAKLLRATKDVAESEEDVARATRIVNQAFKAGGAAASEQAAGILQLSQGLGSGVLQGDELRSVRENAPLLAQAIAEEFDVTIAGLKKLGEEGALTSDRVFQGILRGEQQIAAAFDRTNATIGESFTRVQNALIEYIGAGDEAVGATEKIAAALIVLADNIDLVVAAGGILAGRFIGPVLLGAFARAAPIFRNAGVALAGLATSGRVAAGGLLALRGAVAALGGPFGIILAAASVLPVVLGDTTTVAERLRGATDLGSRAFDEYARATRQAAAEQERLGGRVTATTKALVAQSRVELQNTLRAFEEARSEALDDLLGVGVFDKSELTRVFSILGPNSPLSEDGRFENRFLSDLREDLRAIEDGRGDVRALSRDLKALGGVGKEVSRVLSSFDIELGAGNFEDLRAAAQPMIELADVLGLFPEQIAAIDAAQSQADLRAAWIDLRSALLEAEEAGELVRSKAFEAAVELIDGAAEAEEGVEKANQVLDATGEELGEILDRGNVFNDTEQGARAAADAVFDLGAAIEGLPKDVSSRIGQLGRFDDDVGAAASLIRGFEGFRATPYFDVNALRAGYGSDTVTLADGSVQRVVQGTRVSIEDANRDLQRRIVEDFRPTVVGQVGQAQYDTLNPAQQATLISIAYNSGSLPSAIAQAVRDGLSDQAIADAIAGDIARIDSLPKLSAQEKDAVGKRRIAEASVFVRGVGNDEAIAREERRVADAARDAERQAQEAQRLAEENLRQAESKQGLIDRARESIELQRLEIETMGASIEEQVRQRVEFELLTQAKQQGIDVDRELTESGRTYREEIAAIAAEEGRLALAKEERLDADRALQDAQSDSSEANKVARDTILDIASGARTGTEALRDLTQWLRRAAAQAILFGEGPLANVFGFTPSRSFLGGLGFSDGGYTGSGGKYDVAGVVHRDEFVFSKEATRAIGVARLRELHNAARRGGFADGGYTGGTLAALPVPDFARRAVPAVNVAAPRVHVETPEPRVIVVNSREEADQLAQQLLFEDRLKRAQVRIQGLPGA